MKKRNLKTLSLGKENVVSLTGRILGGALPTTQQSTVRPTRAGSICEFTKQR